MSVVPETWQIIFLNIESIHMFICVCLHVAISIDHVWQVIYPQHFLFSKFTRDERNCYLFVYTSAWNSCKALYRGKMK